ncbi:MAG: hypothetical protein WCY49_03375 [Anaerovoracaceae bacterium]|nr:hypothetical protein [Clostridiales bacterium]
MKNTLIKTVILAGLFLILILPLSGCKESDLVKEKDQTVEETEETFLEKEEHILGDSDLEINIAEKEENKTQKDKEADRDSGNNEDGKKEPTIKADLEKDNEVPEDAETTPEKNISKEDELVTEGTTFQEILVGKEGNIEDILRDFDKARVYKDIQKYYRVIPKTDILMTVEHNLVGTEILRIITSDLKIFILIKGSSFIRMRQATEELYIISGAANGSPLPDFDYIGYFHPLDETIIIAPNPFR